MIFLLSCVVLPWRKQEGWNRRASFKFALSFHKKLFDYEYSWIFTRLLKGPLKGFLCVSCKLCVCSCGIRISFTCIPFHYLVFIKVTFFLFMGGYICAWAWIMPSTFPELFALETSSWYHFEVEGGRQLHWKLENTALKPHLEFLDSKWLQLKTENTEFLYAIKLKEPWIQYKDCHPTFMLKSIYTMLWSMIVVRMLPVYV